MGGSGTPPPRERPARTPIGGEPDREKPGAPSGGDAGQELGGPGGKGACPDNFPSEVSDIPAEMREMAEGLNVGAEIPIELREDDPAFVLGGSVLGWLADNIEEVAACLRAGWRYHGEVTENRTTPTGPVILVRVFATSPST